MIGTWRVTSFTGCRRCGRSVVLTGGMTERGRVHLAVVLVVRHPGGVEGVPAAIVLAGDVVKGLAIWPDVLHLSDGLGRRGHLAQWTR